MSLPLVRVSQKPLAPEGRGVGVRGEAGKLLFCRRPARACAATESRRLPFATPPCRGRVRVGVETVYLIDSTVITPIPAFPLRGGRS